MIHFKTTAFASPLFRSEELSLEKLHFVKCSFSWTYKTSFSVIVLSMWPGSFGKRKILVFTEAKIKYSPISNTAKLYAVRILTVAITSLDRMDNDCFFSEMSLFYF